MHLLKTVSAYKHLVASASDRCVAAVRLIKHLPREKQAMEMTEWGKTVP
jgi:hypothetical protein